MTPMPSTRQFLATAVACLGLGCATPSSTEQHGNSDWGSDAADLSIQPDKAILRLLASGSCVGSYVEVEVPVLSLAFDLTGTYTQLTGAYPGKVTHPAQVSGTFRGDLMRVTVTVPSLSAVIGPLDLTRGVSPLDLTRGVSHNWTNCLYP